MELSSFLFHIYLQGLEQPRHVGIRNKEQSDNTVRHQNARALALLVQLPPTIVNDIAMSLSP